MHKRSILTGVVLLALLTGCSAPAISEETSFSTAPVTTEESAVQTSAETTATAAETTSGVPMLPPNTSGKVEIRTISGSMTYPFNAYLITSAEGETAVVDPAIMPAKSKLLINPVIIASTHIHDDHNDKNFADSYECEKIIRKQADVTVGSFHVYTVQSSHSNDVINATSGNTIIVFEVDGLRIAHMGDIGQTELTAEQLELLGEIDIAFMQFENSYSTMTLENEKGFDIIEQLNPKIVIPTHYTEDAIPVLTENYGEITYIDDLFAISAEDLPEDTLNVYIINNNYLFD